MTTDKQKTDRRKSDRERHLEHMRAIEAFSGLVKTLPNHRETGDVVEPHSHSRAQLLYARGGVIMVTTDHGRWMVPPEHALWIPPRVEHALQMLGAVDTLSLYMTKETLPGIADNVRVVEVSSLARELIIAATSWSEQETPERFQLIVPLLLDVISRLPESALGLPSPADPRLARLCQNFVGDPATGLDIDTWANEMSMSRRTFTRAFRREMGVSLSTWRQQACLFAALPRLVAGEPVTAVALSLGYDSIAAFTTMFKRMLGAPPRAYLNSRMEVEAREA
jgi:AraC-like DNA-binding protein